MAALLLTPCRGVTSFSIELNQGSGSARLSSEIERGIGSFEFDIPIDLTLKFY